MSIIFKEAANQAAVDRLNAVFERLTKLNWFQQAGNTDEKAEVQFKELSQQLNIADYEFRWVAKEDLRTVIENIDFTDSSIWNVLKELPDQYKEKIVAAKLTDVLEQLVDRLPEVVFHPAFDGAFQQFSEEKTVNHLTVLAIYLSLLICTATLAGEEQSLAPLVDMLESGHAPIGLEGNTVYVI